MPDPTSASSLHLGPPSADGQGMRSKVEIVQIRAADIQSGDVVNKRGPEKDGWIEVDRVEELESGESVVHDVQDRDSFSATGYDLIWLQTIHTLEANSHLAMPV
jgi:hypothetical protein